MEFTQAQAAKLSALDDRDFRLFVDEGSIRPTPETKDFGRGKSKLFSRAETRIASILRALNIRQSEYRKHLADWIRAKSTEFDEGLKRSSEQNPCYWLVETVRQERAPQQLRGNLRIAAGLAIPSLIPFVGREREDENRLISVMVSTKDGKSRPMTSFVAVNLTDVLRWERAEDHELEAFFGGTDLTPWWVTGGR
ncbi:hypothetical protein [Mesorhizobium sp.]|uniref:hypothetical protein n=1 Tax=Mesorhizobium sp. TaxID=1871066 RepID=UPI000FE72F96|nr:hypothetical protein [Mesorhizobium sp.]RWH32207.1 MAG: hypothetical protein EOQ76_03695 [Mesorhizobium sp.]RWH40833.1 MAG: hypothetical protein EOQ79_02640 [Mesorhizobium sp.]TIM64444.1 MAG: hypothetical protein E5Y52_19750 [Mesorhizobium sp.]TIR61456.1 MAG: hypothetical protein E5X22_04660 [Mesorhizobium sp.]TIR70650.1 MAG: hypothetical protein E5X24_08420 [Mesorhizobium sp.]